MLSLKLMGPSQNYVVCMPMPAGHKTPRRSTRLSGSTAQAHLPSPSPSGGLPDVAEEQEDSYPRAQQQQQQQRRRQSGAGTRSEMQDFLELEAAGQATPATRLRMLRSRGGKQDG
jgi:hypothetical protein